ncbi:uncharacterized protein K441DRAFT_666520 [Cenococcum geophilum 1.58]|uniref:uncharacterized protein n=1 Tax=Cenococcum geophilum 1.58 TaxID=794803 RepID=UPI00358FADD9|nr:hypothetical protein K441DRAFT_666520 [Cenococcum geophilum 1.58]
MDNPDRNANSSPLPLAVRGLSLTPLTQCLHYHSALDLIAIKFRCCRAFYACIDCHAVLADHPPTTWGKEEREEPAVLCGDCKHVLTIDEYFGCGSKCTKCGAGFNPGCKGHWGRYFEI